MMQLLQGGILNMQPDTSRSASLCVRLRNLGDVAAFAARVSNDGGFLSFFEYSVIPWFAAKINEGVSSSVSGPVGSVSLTSSLTSCSPRFPTGLKYAFDIPKAARATTTQYERAKNKNKNHVLT